MSSLTKMTFSTATNQDKDLITLVYTGLLPQHITFLVPLMLTLLWMSMTFFVIYLKHLIKFGMMNSLINSRVMQLMVTFLNLLLLNKRCQRVALNLQS